MSEATHMLEYARCRTCDSRFFPVPVLDPCGHDDVELQPFEEEGQVYSWTRSWQSEVDSVLIAMVDFADGALRVTAPVRGSEEIAIGGTARIVWDPELPYAVALA